MKAFLSNYRIWVVIWMVLLAVNLAVGTQLYAQEHAAAKSAAAQDGAAQDDDPYEMYSLFSTVVEQVRAHYVDADASTYQNLIYGALRGMMQSLDPYSQFMDAEEFTEMREDTAGKFGGLGITIGMREGLLTVISPMEGTPAFRAGILPDDKIVEIDGETTDKLDLSDAVKRLRGDPGTDVTIKVFRPRIQKYKTFTLERAIINVPSVKDARILPGGIAYIRMLQFGQDTARDFQRELENFVSQDAKAIVLDLRGNPGGLLTAAVEVAQPFLKRSDLIVFTRGRNGEVDHSYRARPRFKFPDIPMVVLINGASASASEIVAGALQDNHRAILVGEKSFGKGSVQTIIPQEGDTAIRLTTAKYYTPSERVIHDNGIEPDVVVPISFETWRKIILARNKAEETAAGEAAQTDADDDMEGWTESAPDQDNEESLPEILEPATEKDADTEPSDDDTASGEVSDPQLDRACDMLRGILVFRQR